MRWQIWLMLVLFLVCVSCTTTEFDEIALEKNEENVSVEVDGKEVPIIPEEKEIIIKEEINLTVESNSTVSNINTPVNVALAQENEESAMWQPTPGLRWHWQISGDVATNHNVEVYDVDLFEASPELIEKLHAREVKVICYLSVGSIEDWRDDAVSVPAKVIGRELEGWPGERWLDIRDLEALDPWITQRFDLAVAKGCDAVEPDNVDGFEQETGFDLTPQDQLTFNRWLAKQAHDRDLAIGLKNDLTQISSLVDDFDFAVNEECFEQGDCEELLPFVEQGKAVFGVEYVGEPETFCGRARAMKFSWIRAEYDLDGPTKSC